MQSSPGLLSSSLSVPPSDGWLIPEKLLSYASSPLVSGASLPSEMPLAFFCSCFLLPATHRSSLDAASFCHVGMLSR